MPDPLAQAAALADTSHLPDFEGLQVVASGVEIPGAAGGLRDPMKIDPQAFHQGEVVYVALKCNVQKVRHEPIVKDEPGGVQRRVHVFKVDTATIVAGDLVAAALDEQQKRIIVAREQAGGGQIPGQQEAWGDVDADALAAAHNEGDHAGGKVEGCPTCQAEDDAAAEEAEQDG